MKQQNWIIILETVLEAKKKKKNWESSQPPFWIISIDARLHKIDNKTKHFTSIFIASSSLKKKEIPVSKSWGEVCCFINTQYTMLQITYDKHICFVCIVKIRISTRYTLHSQANPLNPFFLYGFILRIRNLSQILVQNYVDAFIYSFSLEMHLEKVAFFGRLASHGKILNIDMLRKCGIFIMDWCFV